MDPLPSTREPRPMRRDAAEGPLRFRRGRHHRWIQKRSRVGGDGEVAQEHVGGEDQGAAQGLSINCPFCISSAFHIAYYPTSTPSVPVCSFRLTSAPLITPFYPLYSHFLISPYLGDKGPIEERRYENVMDAYDLAVELGVSLPAKALNVNLPQREPQRSLRGLQ
ncbi:hypothetical protein BC938DRAFT_470713 [Jimgerdemannia flammicorona]|uniref:Uncharacterized protein n=1 Tax=Jimgerdemannia flammicorona TaxID=994334 RepID=A0A433QV22_9FUNG|nr:hypothetical protein BC938DRAFT_470713 [Jimgerdemannia flammicorona]